MSDDNSLKIVILGEGRVGKTSILARYFKNKFNEGEQTTINPSLYEKEVEHEGKKYKLNFWDTAGQEQFNAINTIYYQNAIGALIVYDVSLFETFNKVKTWVKTLQEAVGKDIIFVVAGNKFDLVGKNGINEHESEIDGYCRSQNCKHFFSSAKTGFQIEDAFNSLITSVLNKVKSGKGINTRKGRRLEIGEEKEEKKESKGGCC
jgi:small GTP-binding protein